MHPLGSPYVRDQLAQRVRRVNDVRLVPDGAFILYWMQSTHRLHENWALRFAVLEGERLNRPVLVYHELASDDEHASDRMHAFALEGIRDIARDARAKGYCYRFVLNRGETDLRAVARIARRACLVVTDDTPAGAVRGRTMRLANIAPCRVIAVDSVGVVPAAMFPREEYAARTIRPKLAKLRDLALEPVEDRAPRREMPASLVASLEIDAFDPLQADIPAAIARCAIDHSIPPSPVRGGTRAARARLEHFARTGLQQYRERRAEPNDDDGSSRLSPYVRWGHLSAAEVARTVIAEGPAEEAEAFLDEMITWRELSLNFCHHDPAHRSIDAVPEWARRAMADHADDEREATYALDALDRAETHEPLWNAGQRELLATGQMHNAVRMLWGKSVLLWTATYEAALEALLWLNDRYALDGRDPNSYANILWCFGKFDRPFARRPVWGTIRPMSLARARTKFDVASYVARWSDAVAVSS